MGVEEDIKRITDAGGGPKDVERFLKSQGIKFKRSKADILEKGLQGAEALTKLTVPGGGALSFLGGTAARAAFGGEEGKKTAKQRITGAQIAGAFTPFSPLAVGTGAAAKELISGKSIPKALKTGATAAAIDAALMLTGGLATKGLAKVGQFLIKGKVPAAAIGRAVENVDILKTPQKSVLNVGDDILKVTDDFANLAKESYQNAIKNIASPKAVTLNAVRSRISSLGIPKPILKGILRRAANANAIDLTDDVIDVFVGTKPGKIAFNDAKTINSLLFEVVGSTPTESLGKGAIKRVGQLRSVLTDAMEVAGPGIRRANRDYARRVALYMKARKAVSSGSGALREVKESSVRNIGLELLDVSKNKAKDVRTLAKLQAEVGKNFIDPLKNSVAREAIDKGGVDLAGALSRAVASGGAAGSIGFGAGGGAAAGIAAPAAMAVSQLAGQPSVIRGGIRAGQYLPSILKAGTSPSRVIIDQILAQKLGGQ